MTLCPYAVVAGCKRCPIFSVCPLKTVIGDHVPGAENVAAGDGASEGGKPSAKAGKKGGGGRKKQG